MLTYLDIVIIKSYAVLVEDHIMDNESTETKKRMLKEKDEERKVSRKELINEQIRRCKETGKQLAQIGDILERNYGNKR